LNSEQLHQAFTALERLGDPFAPGDAAADLARVRIMLDGLADAAAAGPHEADLLQLAGTAVDAACGAAEALTQEREAGASRERAAERHATLLRIYALGRFAGAVAHEFNNVLMVIQNYADFVAEECPPGTQARADAEEIRLAATRGAQLTARLLAFGDAGGGATAAVDIAAVVAAAELRLREQVPTEVELRVALAPDLAAIDAEPKRLEAILSNLVSNAIRAIEGAGSVAINASMVELDDAVVVDYPELLPGPHVALTISDDGIGMDRAMVERIFDPFFTTSDRMSGIGLTIVHRIVEEWTGAIRVQSELGKGTVVTVLLPTSDTGINPGEAGPAGGSEHGRLLLCEDEAAIRLMCARLLERSGYEVLVAENGTEGLRVLAAEADQGRTIDLLLSDVVMPGPSGFEVAHAARELFPAIRVALMSGYSDELISRQGPPVGGAVLLEKPFGATVLVAQVRELLGRGPDAPDR